MSEVDIYLGPLEEYLISLDDFNMDKRIGKGAYGEVWLATHKETNTKCAIKKLLLDQLDDVNLQFFVREVSILASCHDMFLLPFQGFTNHAPYSIATEFIPNGSLYEALQHKPGAPKLSPSHKTLIAMGMAHGMMALHKVKIIHRDLKSLNILLDDKLLPKICDFGISRFMNENEVEMTREIGTPHWMAPELFQSQHYTEKVDVYAFGIILWEMLTERIPYKGRTGIQVATAVVTNDERPAIPSTCPPELKELIQRCWDRDPDRRPSFRKVYKMFKKREVMFKGTEPRAVAALEKLIDDDEKKNADPLQHLLSRRHKSKKRSHTPTFKLPTPTNDERPFVPPGGQVPMQPYVGSNVIPSPPSMCAERTPPAPLGNLMPPEMPNRSPPPDSLQAPSPHPFVPPSVGSIASPPSSAEDRNARPKAVGGVAGLENPLAPTYLARLDSQFARLSMRTAKALFGTVVPHLAPTYPLQISGAVVEKLAAAVARNCSFCRPLADAGVVAALPFHDPRFIPFTASILSALVEVCIDTLRVEPFQSLAAYAGAYPSEVIHVFSKFAQHAKDVSDTLAGPVFTALLETRGDLASSAHGAQYLAVVFALYNALPLMQADAEGDVAQALVIALASKDIETAKQAYSFILALPEFMSCAYQQEATIVSHLADEGLQDLALVVISKMPVPPPSKRLVAAVSELVGKPLAAYVLCQLAEAPALAPIVLQHGGWFDIEDPRLAFKVLLSLFTVKEMRPLISEHPRLPAFLVQMLSVRSAEVNLTISTIIRRMTITPELVRRLSISGFIGAFVTKSLATDDVEQLHACIMLCDALARYTYVPDFDIVVPQFKRLLLDQRGLAIPAFTLVVVFNQHEKLRALLLDAGIGAVLRMLNVPPQFKMFHDQLLSTYPE